MREDNIPNRLNRVDPSATRTRTSVARGNDAPLPWAEVLRKGVRDAFCTGYILKADVLIEVNSLTHDWRGEKEETEQKEKAIAHSTTYFNCNGLCIT